MRKHSVPAAPLPTWANKTTTGKTPAVQQSGFSATAPFALLPPLDAGFLRGVYFSLCWFGALLSVVAGVVTQSLMVSWSFAVGVLLAAGLLKTQEFFARNLAQQVQLRRAAQQKILTGRQMRLPLHAFAGAKYLVVAGLMGVLLSNGWLWPVPFALGFSTLQVVIVGKVLGRALQSRMRPIREVYVRPRRSTL